MSQPTETAFRAEAEAFLSSNAPRRVEEVFAWGKGSDHVALLEEKDAQAEARELAEARRWKALEFDAGFGWITGPPEYGGRGLPMAYERAYRELASGYLIPDQTPFAIGLGMVGPTILAHATPEVKQRYLRALWRGDIVACQLFSEPVAGSDLAGIQTRAERDGDEWVVSGQKVWTSGAHYSDIGEIITRTSPEKPKHQGLTMFLVDMHASGIEVRPLRQMTGGASFNEVFLDEVRIPDSHRLGDVDGGWAVALTTLMNERAAIGGGAPGLGNASFARFAAMVRHFGVNADPVVRQQLADVYVRSQVHRLTTLRGMARLKAGQAPGPEMSIGKLSLAINMQRIVAFLTAVLGPRLVADTGEWGTYAWARLVLGVPGMRIAGGTDEIMRNIVGERVLGLPREPSVREPAGPTHRETTGHDEPSVREPGTPARREAATS